MIRAAAANVTDKPLSLDNIADRVGKNRISINIVWTFITGFLVMFMQAGFAMVETGLNARQKRFAHDGDELHDLSARHVGILRCGFAFMFGGIGRSALGAGTGGLDSMYSITIAGKTIDLIGYKGFFLGPSVYDVGILRYSFSKWYSWIRRRQFLPAAKAERWKFSAFMLYGAALGTILYPVYGNWVWGGGWLSTWAQTSTLATARSILPVPRSFIIREACSLIAAWFVGPRLGKYNKAGSTNLIPRAQLVPMAIIGTFILAFGWFGFNPGSTLAGTDLRISVVAVNTMLASATGAHDGAVDVECAWR